MENKLLCTPVLLPFEKEGYTGESHIWHKEGYQLQYDYLISKAAEELGLTPHRLYLVSDEEIREGDWVIYKAAAGNLGVSQCLGIPESFNNDPDYFRIEACTDKSLGLPLIPQSFIEEYVQKQGKIDKVYVKMACYGDLTLSFEQYHEWKPEVINGEVIILPVKDSWSEEEFKSGCLTFMQYWMNLSSSERLAKLDNPIDDWFNKNY